jgi:hypothetical protein
VTAEAVSPPAAPYTPRHASARPNLTQRARNIVSIRIPAPVNAVSDWVERNTLPAAGVGAVLGSLVLAAWVPSVLMNVVVGCVAVAVTSMFWQPRLAAMRAERDRLDQKNAALDEQVRKTGRGDATAPTQQLRVIGERGEPT